MYPIAFGSGYTFNSSRLQITNTNEKFFFNYRFSCKIAFLKICSNHRNESRESRIRWMPVKPDRRSKVFSRFLSPGAIQESGIREDTSYAAPISIDLPSFRSVRSYDGQIFRSACLTSLIPRPTTVRSTNSKLISGTRPFFGEREGWAGSDPGRPVIVNPLGAPGSPWSLCYDRTLGTGALGTTIRLGHL